MRHVAHKVVAVIVGLTCSCSVHSSQGENKQDSVLLQLTVEKPSLSLLELESEVAIPLEAVVKPLPFVEDCETEIRQGSSSLVITLRQDVSVEESLQQLAAAITALSAVGGDAELTMLERLYSDRATTWVVFTSEDLEKQTTIENATLLHMKLAQTPCVGRVTAIGAPHRVIDVTVDTAKCRAYSLSASDIYEAIRTHVIESEPGSTQNRSGIREPDSLADLSQSLPDLVLNQTGGNPTRLKDLAQVRSGILYQSKAWLDRDRAIAFEVQAKDDDRESVLASIEEEQPDWHKALSAAGEGARFMVVKPELKVELTLPAGVTDAQFDRIAEMASTRIREQLNTRVHLLSVRTGPDSNLLQLYLQRSKTDEPNPLSSQAVRESLADIPGVSTQISDLRKDSDESIELRILGADLEVLRNAAKQASAQIHRIDGVAEVRTDSHLIKPEVSVEIRKEAAARLGVKTADIATSIRVMMSPNGPEDLLSSRVCLRFQEFNAESLEKMPVTTEDGQSIPLSVVADIHLKQTPLVIRRRNGRRMVKLIVQPASQDDRQRIEREVRTIGENLRSAVTGKDYLIEIE